MGKTRGSRRLAEGNGIHENKAMQKGDEQKESRRTEATGKGEK